MRTRLLFMVFVLLAGISSVLLQLGLQSGKDAYAYLYAGIRWAGNGGHWRFDPNYYNYPFNDANVRQTVRDATAPWSQAGSAFRFIEDPAIIDPPLKPPTPTMVYKGCLGDRTYPLEAGGC